MKLKLDINDFKPQNGLKFDWEENFIISTKVENEIITLTANKEGLISLAKQLLMLAQDPVPAGSHLHYDEYNSLEDNSLEFVIEKI